MPKGRTGGLLGINRLGWVEFDMTMKTLVTQCLRAAGIWHLVGILRRIPAILRWLRGGCRGAAPHAIKMVIVKSYLTGGSINTFIETGTYLGDTLDHLSRDKGIRCMSIELSAVLYETACRRFAGRRNVRLFQGDSGQRLPELLKEIDSPVLFWLDGHYSSGVTASANIHTPISAELHAILNHSIKRHVILIDDARLFDGANAYPHLDQLLQEIRNNGRYSVEVSTDIIRLTPLAASCA